MASANLLGKLLASYLSTSNDTLAVSFRAHYAATGSPAASVSSPTFSPAPRIRRKPASLRLTSATFTYRWFEYEQRRIIQLYQCLLRAGWISSNTNPDDFLSLFSGCDTNCKIHWTDVDINCMDWMPAEYQANLTHPLAERQFKNDIEAMTACDACVLVLPCGRSAHTEAGWFAGQGKPVYAYILDRDSFEPELMYKLFTKVCISLEELIESIEPN